jgi:hypothetical protein
MATETLVPDGTVFTLTQLSGNVGDVDNTIASADGVFLTNLETNGNTPTVRASFPTASGDLTTTTGVNQTFRVRVRKDATGGNNPDFTIAAIDVGNSNTLASASRTIDTTNNASGLENYELTWNAGAVSLSDGAGANVEIEVSQTTGGTGRGANRRWIEIDEIEWVVEYDVAVGGAAVTQAILI